MKPMHTHRYRMAALGVLSALSLAQAVYADEPTEELFTFAQPVNAEALQALRGGSELVLNHMTLDGTTADNSASHVVTGANLIGSGAFASASGMPVVIQNSGANVLIQSAVILNLQVQ